MKKLFLFLIAAAFFLGNAFGQLFNTRSGFIGFYSKTTLEDIKAENNQVYAVIDVVKKNIAFSLLLKGFIFKKELMQQHFNENYVESDKYPKAYFIGKYTGELNVNKEGTYTIPVTGNLTLHNITRVLQTAATFTINANILTGTAQFFIKPEDFNIAIPSIVRDKITKEITVSVKINSPLVK